MTQKDGTAVGVIEGDKELMDSCRCFGSYEMSREHVQCMQHAPPYPLDSTKRSWQAGCWCMNETASCHEFCTPDNAELIRVMMWNETRNNLQWLQTTVKEQIVRNGNYENENICVGGCESRGVCNTKPPSPPSARTASIFSPSPAPIAPWLAVPPIVAQKTCNDADGNPPNFSPLLDPDIDLNAPFAKETCAKMVQENPTCSKFYFVWSDPVLGGDGTCGCVDPLMDCSQASLQQDNPKTSIYLIQPYVPVCMCTTPGGAAPDNGFTCSDTTTGRCAPEKTCDNAEPWDKNRQDEGCLLGGVSCKCSNPNVEGEGLNGYVCSNDPFIETYCGVGKVCELDERFSKDELFLACRKPPPEPTIVVSNAVQLPPFAPPEDWQCTDRWQFTTKDTFEEQVRSCPLGCTTGDVNEKECDMDSSQTACDSDGGVVRHNSVAHHTKWCDCPASHQPDYCKGTCEPNDVIRKELISGWSTNTLATMKECYKKLECVPGSCADKNTACYLCDMVNGPTCTSKSIADALVMTEVKQGTGNRAECFPEL